MEPEILKTVGKIAGIGGLAIGTFLILFRDVIRKNIFPNLTKQQAYRLLILIVILVWSLAIIGIAAWTISLTKGSTSIGINTQSSINQNKDSARILQEQLRPIYFEGDEVNITREIAKKLDEYATLINQSKLKIIIEGHRQPGKPLPNILIGNERADKVARYLTNEGKVDSDRLTVVSFGGERPLKSGDNSYNNRVEFKVVGLD